MTLKVLIDSKLTQRLDIMTLVNKVLCREIFIIFLIMKIEFFKGSTSIYKSYYTKI